MLIRDGEWVLFDHDFKLGRTVWKRTDSNGNITFRTDHRVDEVIKDATQMRNDADKHSKADWRHLARVPIGMHYEKLAEANAQHDDRYIGRWLDEHSAFKTR